MQIRQWVKNHKKEFTNRFIRESGAIPNPDEPSCVFMAGLPGAGKTEYSKMFISELGVPAIRIDMDEIASMIDTYKPEKADLFREGATSLQNDIYEKSRKGYYPFIMDGTLASDKSIKSVKSAINKGYAVRIIYIKQDPLIAWRNTREREKIKHRAIDKEGFINSYERTINNLRTIRELYGTPIDIIVKNGNNTTLSQFLSSDDETFDKLVKTEYNKDKLKELLENE